MSEAKPHLGEEALQRLIDGQLPARDEGAVRAALALDPALAARVEAQAEDRVALRAALAPKATEPVPERLRAAVQPRVPRWQAIAAAVALFALGVGAGWAIGQHGASDPVAAGKATLVSEAQRAHAVYAVEVRHPVEVGAQESAHLMAWLSKRLGLQLTAPDLLAQGFALVGGRLLPAEAGPAAQLMYEDATGLRLTLYITAMPGSESAFRFARSTAGVSSLVWLEGGYGCAISAPLERAQLWPIAQSVYEALAL